LADKKNNVGKNQKKTAPKKMTNKNGVQNGQNRQNVSNSRPSSANKQGRPVNVGARMNIREQTPAKRRTAKETKRINPDSPEIKRTAKRAQGYRIKKKKKRISPVVLANVILFSLVFIIFSSITAVIFYANLVKTDAPPFERLSVKVGPSNKIDNTASVRVNPEQYFRDGVMYINMTTVFEEFDFTITGDTKEIRFITDIKSGENVRFVKGTPFAEINGNTVRLKYNVIEEDGQIYVPAQFFEEYVDGIELLLDEEKSTLSVIRQTTKDVSGVYQEKEITFKLKNSKMTSSLLEDSLTEEEKAKTYFVGISDGDNDLEN